jgi:YD repeat-containing protein
MRFTSIFFLVFLVLFAFSVGAQQPTNADPKMGFYNVTFPKTPESDGIEQVGKIPVNELTGSVDISIPVYNLKGNFLSTPITLSYRPGIRVTQEASWVGLGWDLDAGGRITVETKGDIDRWATGTGQTVPSPATHAAKIQDIYNRLHNSNSVGILTNATPCPTCFPVTDPTVCPACHPPDGVPDDYPTVSDMCQLGSGEPDIFRASFMGHSFAFFFDKVTGNLTFKGEQSTFKIDPTLNSFGLIDHFVITDNDGVVYYFNQQETTSYSLQGNVTQLPTVTTAWLLTKVVHPSGDFIQFNYANFGDSYPMLNMSGFMSARIVGGDYTLTQSPSGGGQNQSKNSPWYLTSIQSPDVEVDFYLGGRTDLYGPGSQRLNQVSVKEKASGIIRKTVNFNYSYFTASANVHLADFASYLGYNLPSTTDYFACHNLRLRLDALTINNLPPYTFQYNTTTIDKLSYAQDHWGYYNGQTNNLYGSNPMSLIPYTGVSASIGRPNFDGNAVRDCSPTTVQAMTLQSMSYPTGGNTVFEFEPHQGVGVSQGFVGGGMRIKTIRNYASTGTLTNSVSYTYSGGVYFGSIYYLSEIYKRQAGSASPGPVVSQFNLNSNGVNNDNELLIAYEAVTVTNSGPNGQANGKIIKSYNVSAPYAAYDVRLPAWPTNPPNTLTTQYLNLSKSMFPPTPAGNLDGKLISEIYQDNNGNTVKTITYSYHQANYNENFYDIRAVDAVDGGIGNTQSFFDQAGWRAAIIFVSPNKTYTTLKDCVIEVDNLNGVSVTNKTCYTYNSLYQLQSEQHFNSDGTSTTTNYQYPIDLQGTGSTVVNQMLGSHIYTPVLNTSTSRGGSPVSSIIQNYYSPFTNIFVPQFTQVQIAANPLETRYLYNAYDVQGHLLERQLPNGVKEDFVWGYGHRFPVAKVLGSDYATINGLINSGIISTPATDDAIRTELNKLRTGLVGALVNTYTYNVFNGLTSQTDPTGITSYFNYDGFGRLSYVQDQHLNVVKRFAYGYTGTPDGSADALTMPASASNTTSTSWQVVFTNTVGGATLPPFTLNQSSAPTVFANVPAGTYNVTFTANGTLSNYTNLIYNGTSIQAVTDFALSNVNCNVPNSFTLTTGPILHGSISSNSGFSIQTENLHNDGNGLVTGSFVWRSNGVINSGVTYSIATVTLDLVPTVNRNFPVTDSAGRTWTVTVTSSGEVKVSCGFTLSAGTTITFSSFPYSI